MEQGDGRVPVEGGERDAGAWRDAVPADGAPGEALEFVRYCYRRRGLGWPELYDEMCATAARGGWRGMGYDQLAAIGIGFTLRDMPSLIALAARVTDEEKVLRSGGARQAG